MLPWSVCIAFKNPVQELWAVRSTYSIASSVFLAEDYKNTTGVSVHCF